MYKRIFTLSFCIMSPSISCYSSLLVPLKWPCCLPQQLMEHPSLSLVKRCTMHALQNAYWDFLHEIYPLRTGRTISEDCVPPGCSHEWKISGVFRLQSWKTQLVRVYFFAQWTAGGANTRPPGYDRYRRSGLQQIPLNYVGIRKKLRAHLVQEKREWLKVVETDAYGR